MYTTNMLYNIMLSDKLDYILQELSQTMLAPIYPPTNGSGFRTASIM
jgi:hypothetical protein